MKIREKEETSERFHPRKLIYVEWRMGQRYEKKVLSHFESRFPSEETILLEKKKGQERRRLMLVCGRMGYGGGSGTPLANR